MIARERDIEAQKTDRPHEDATASPVAEFRVFGKEMIEKKVKTSGKTGRVYLPGDWVGKQVKIIRID